MPRYHDAPQAYKHLVAHLLDATAQEIEDDALFLDELVSDKDKDKDDEDYPTDAAFHDGDPDEIDPAEESENIDPARANRTPRYPAGAQVKPVVEEIRMSKEDIEFIRGISKRLSTGSVLGYEGEARRFLNFCVDKKLVTTAAEVFERPHPHVHYFFIKYVNHHCDTVFLNGDEKPTNLEVKSHATAERMRAAVLYTYAMIHLRGKKPWQASQTTPGAMEGNPIICDVVADFMISMRRRKAKAGQSSTSSKAMTPEILEQLYNYFTDLPADDEHWCHIHQHLQSHLIDVISFQCMFRSADALRLRFSDMRLFSERSPEDGQERITKLEIDLHTSKTRQFGGEIQTFTFYPLAAHLVHLCVVHAYSYYISHCRHTSGFLFRNINRAGQTSARYLHLLRMRLIDIHIDPILFGTHCNRRGGAQYHFNRGVPLAFICEMGGWSTDWRSSSVWRYIVNEVDVGHFDRANFYNPDRVGQICWQCGSLKLFG
ncbi:hypothetical protein C8R46DRAFT_1218107 [Mycena filopes]|nr:hypothetical protein C8R46DRAFT_1218107 [Mycena filopes]